MAGKTSRTGLQFVQKKLLGKANTSNLKSDGQELIGSSVQLASQVIFGQAIPGNPSTSLWAITGGTVEYVQFSVVPIAGTTYDGNDANAGGDEAQPPGPHAYALALPSNYQSVSSNPKKGTGYYTNGYCLTGSLGGLQIIPQNYSTVSPNPYIPSLYVDSGGSPGTQIPLLDEVDWLLDTYNGVLFLQDYDASKVPAFVRAHMYIGDYLIDVTGGGGGGGGDPAAQYLVLAATGSLSAERVLTPGTGLSGNDGGSGNPYTLSINNSVVATLSGSTFSGPVVAGGGLTGSLQQVSAGVPYLLAGPNVTIGTSSLGQVTISAVTGSGSPAGINTSVQFNDSNAFGGTNSFTFDKNTNTLSVLNISGSLTRLTDGSSYLVAGNNVTITSGSSGQITISAVTGSGGGGGGGALQQSVAPYADNFTTTWMTVGSFEVSWTSPATYTGWTFAAVLAAPVGFSVQARLYDITNNLAVPASVISTNSTVPMKVTSNSLTIPVANSARLYLVQIAIVSGSPTSNDRGVVYSAFNNLS